MSKYLELLENKGFSLEYMNPGTTEKALQYDDAMHAIELIKEDDFAILGGDIVTLDKKGEFTYAYLSWNVDDEKEETSKSYKERSYKESEDYIVYINKILTKKKKPCFIIFAIEDDIY